MIKKLNLDKQNDEPLNNICKTRINTVATDSAPDTTDTEDEHVKMTQGARLTLLMEYAGMKPADIARRLDITRATVSHWVHDRSTPKGETMTKLADLLRCSIDYIATGKNPPAFVKNITANPDATKLATDSKALHLSGDVNPNSQKIIRIKRMGLAESTAELPDELPLPAGMIEAMGCMLDALKYEAAWDNSMAPTFTAGDLLLIDTSITEVAVDGAYLFMIDGAAFARRLHRQPGGGLTIVSDAGSSYPPQPITPPQRRLMSVLGRIVKVWASRSL